MIYVYATPCGIDAKLLYSYVDDDMKKAYDRAAESKRAYPRLLCRALLIHALRLHGADYSQARRKNGYGKEYFVKADSLFFNCSHTNSAVAVAISDGECGVDIEDIPKEYKPYVAKRFFTESEFKTLCNSANQREDFCRLWTKKESYIKYLGVGFSLPISSFECDLSDVSNVCGVLQTTQRYQTAFITATGGETLIKTIDLNTILR